jgi:hypothetical protein
VTHDDLETKFHVQRIIDGTWLTHDLPLTNSEVVLSQLSGPTGVTGELDLNQAEVAVLGMEPWGDWVHVEQAGRIRTSCVLMPWSPEANGIASVNCVGFSSYPHEVHYSGIYNGIQVDPLDVVRHIWGHVETYQPLGVTIDPTTSPIRIGTPAEQVDFDTGDGRHVSFTAGPVQLNWWTAHNCGSKIEQLAKDTPFDFSEEAEWNSTRTDVLRRIKLGYPRLGRQQTGLRFEEDENVTSIIFLAEDEDRYASEVIFTGAGEGRTITRGVDDRPLGRRIRRSVLLSDQSLSTNESATTAARSERSRRQALVGASVVEIDARHPNAPIGSFAAGDDIQLKANYPGDVESSIWHRIVKVSYRPDTEVAVLDVRRSDMFDYGRLA